MMQINDDYYEDLTPEIFETVIESLSSGKDVPVGSQTGRKGSMAQLGPTSLEKEAKAAGIDMAPPPELKKKKGGK